MATGWKGLRKVSKKNKERRERQAAIGRMTERFCNEMPVLNGMERNSYGRALSVIRKLVKEHGLENVERFMVAVIDIQQEALLGHSDFYMRGVGLLPFLIDAYLESGTLESDKWPEIDVSALTVMDGRAVSQGACP